MTRRRPNRSDRAPSSGENRNCISAQAVPNTPKIPAARAVSPPTKRSTSFGSTGMIIPSASTSSRIVTKMKATAARRGGACRTVSVIGSLARRVRVRLLAQRQPDRRAGQIERLAQAVDEIAAIIVRQRIGPGAGRHDGWRARHRLGRIVELEAAAGHGGRRMAGDDLAEPTIERGSRHAPVPHRVDVDDRLYQAVDALAGLPGEGDDRRALDLGQPVIGLAAKFW